MPTDFKLSRNLGWGLTVSIGVLTVAGILALFLPAIGVTDWGPGLTALCVVAIAAAACFSLGLANCAASHAQRALAADKKLFRATATVSLVCAFGFAFASMIGVHIGWSILAHAVAGKIDLPPVWAVDIVALFLGFAKPAMNWAVEGRIGVEQHLALEHERKELALSQMRRDMLNTSAITPAAPVPPAGPKQPLGFDATAFGKDSTVLPFNGTKAAAAFGILAVGAAALGGALPTMEPAKLADAAPVKAAAVQQVETGWSAEEAVRFADVRKLHAEGLDAKAIIGQTGYAPAKVQQWLAILNQNAPQQIELAADDTANETPLVIELA